MKKRNKSKRLFSPNSLIPLSVIVLGLATLTALSLTKKQKTSIIGETTSNDFSKNVSHEIRFFSDTKQYLKSGDVLFITVVRNNANTPMTKTDSKWTSRVGLLSSVTTPGIHKILLFSAVDDVRDLINQVPGSVDYIGYNLEGEISPSSDFADISASVQAFSKIVHSSGRKMFFAPIRLTWDVLERENKLETVLKTVDAVGIQEQKNYQNLSSDVRAKYRIFKSINPNLQIFIQLWLGQQTPQQIIDGYLSIQDYLDVAGIGTYSETENVVTVLKGLGRGTSTAVPTPTPKPTSTPTSKPSPTLTPTPTVVCPQCPDVRLSLFTHDQKKGVKIAWQKVSGADYYSVFRCSGSGCSPDTAIAQVSSNKNTYSDTNGDNGYSSGRSIALRYSVRPYKQGCYLPSCPTFEISF